MGFYAILDAVTNTDSLKPADVKEVDIIANHRLSGKKRETLSVRGKPCGNKSLEPA